MKKENFSLLLEDLYNIYNPDHTRYIPELVDRYSGLEFSAVDMIFVKYNYPDASIYDASRNTDEYKLSLIKEYGNGLRPLKDESIESLIRKKKEAEEAPLVATKQYSQELDSLVKKISELESSLSKENTSAMEVIVRSNYRSSELVLPNKEYLLSLGKGARIIIQDKEGKIVGLVIEDILLDNISGPVPSVEITLNKA